MSNLTFAPGESNISEARFSPSVVLFWLKADMAVTNRRVVMKLPNTLLGLIPLGYSDGAFPLNNVASVGVEVKFSLLRAFFGVVFAIGGLSLLGSSPVLGVIFLLLGISLLGNALSAALLVVNNGGGKSWVRVSIFERQKVEQFRDQINQRLFADNEGLRHNDIMGAHFVNTQLQQQQLRTMQAMNQTLGGGGSADGRQIPTSQPAPWQGAVESPRQYQVGDVVNSHRFDGTSWVPLPRQANPGWPPPPPQA